MKRLLLLLCCCLFMVLGQVQAVNAQEGTKQEERFTTHRVAMGETVSLLAKKYKMTPQDIYEYNKDAVEGISANMSLKIPLHRQIDLSAPKQQKRPLVAPQRNTDAVAEAVPFDAPAPEEEILQPEIIAPAMAPEAVPVAQTVAATHKVQPGETLTALSRRYGVTVAEIQKQNAAKLKHGLQAGQTLTIMPGAAETAVPAPDAQQYVLHNVQPGETLFGLSRKYSITVGQITAANPKALKRGLKAGQELKIPAGAMADAVLVQQAGLPAEANMPALQSNGTAGAASIKANNTTNH